MTDYTAREIDDAVIALQDEDADYYDEESTWGSIAYGDGPKALPLRGQMVPLVLVKQEGGQGQGDEIWCVVKIGDQLFRKEGYYASHYGSDWDGDLYECEAVARVVTFYEYKEGGTRA